MNPGQFQKLLQTALTHHQAGRLAEADRLYRQALGVQPNHFDPLHLSGVVAYQQGRFTEAVELYTRALRVNPKSGPCVMRLGLALAASGRHQEAERQLREAVRLDPKAVDAWMGLAVTLRVLGKPAESIACYQRVVSIDPRHADAHDQIGALTADTQGMGAGVVHFQRALALDPKHAAAWCNLGLALLHGEKYAEALQAFDQSLAANPRLTQARVARALAFQQTYQLDRSATEFRAALAEHPAHHQARSGLLLTLNYLPEVGCEELFAEHLEFGKIAESQIGTAPRPLPTPRVPRSNRPLRVAFLSPDLRAHSVAYFLEPLLAHLDRARFEVLLYHDHPRVDATSERLQRLASRWRNFAAQLDAVVEETIRGDGPDILVDLAGHTGINRLPLFARRLAPVQLSYLGYPNTTGLRAMDFRLVDPVTDPEGEGDAHHTEKLVRFAPCAWCYQPPSAAPEPARAAEGPLTFGSFNNLAKLTSHTLQLWSRVLAAVPDSRLFLKGHGLHDPLVRGIFEAKLRDAGLDLARVEMETRTPTLAGHLELYRRVDVALDPFPYHGTTTTCEALWMGVPVVTQAGKRHAARVGCSLLQAVKHPEWIAQSPDEYVQIAAQLANAPETRARLRTTLREELRSSTLMDAPAQARRFGEALLRCWESKSA